MTRTVANRLRHKRLRVLLMLALVLGSGIALVAPSISLVLHALATKALLRGISENDVALVNQALQYGADANCLDHDFQGEPDDPSGIKQIIVDKATSKTPAGGGYTALMRAAAGGNADIVKALLEHGALPDTRAKDSDTALAEASGCVEVVSVLLQHGADVNLINRGGETALYDAIALKQTEEMDLLLNSGAFTEIRDQFGITPLQSAVIGGDIDTVKCLLRHGARPDLQDDDMSALAYAAMKGNYAIAKELIAHGARVDRDMANGNTPLEMARRNDRADIVVLLKKAGAKEEK